jgi:hypothetical protein
MFCVTNFMLLIFGDKVLATHADGVVRVLCAGWVQKAHHLLLSCNFVLIICLAVLVSIDEVVACIINDNDFTLSCESSSPVVRAGSEVVSACPPLLHAPDAHPEVTKSIFAFIGVPALDSSAVPRLRTHPMVSDTPTHAAAAPPRSRDPSIDSSVQSGSHPALRVSSADDVVDFDRDLQPFLLKQQLSQEERRQCLQDSIFFISIAEAALFLKNFAILMSFLVSCVLVPWRLPIVLSLLFKSNDTIKRFRAYHACCLMDLVAIERSEMLATSLQRMQCGLRNVFSERRSFGQYASMSAITGRGRSQRVYEQLLHQMCDILKHSDSDGSDAAQELLQAHNSSILALQVHVAFYLNELHSNVATTTHRSTRFVPRQRLAAIAIANAISVRFPLPPPPPAFSTEHSQEDMVSTEQLAPDEACMRAVDQQARMATTVAAHFGRSEADVVAALRTLHDRKQQLKVWTRITNS